ncbi:NAD/NADP transhydrogenase beta subunit [Paraburkholderia sp. WSM4177]|nr:NAD/NADP transhydrogenase beta subunit [Paraburkholderia sp. WSM4177]MBB5488656.1 NAD/NADP transhydrogenase beta subunit [Paraburkholderia sp. WSM4180]
MEVINHTVIKLTIFVLAIYVVTLLYPVASVCFIQALKGLSHTKMAGIGNTFGMVRMAIAIR